MLNKFSHFLIIILLFSYSNQNFKEIESNISYLNNILSENTLSDNDILRIKSSIKNKYNLYVEREVEKDKLLLKLNKNSLYSSCDHYKFKDFIIDYVENQLSNSNILIYANYLILTYQILYLESKKEFATGPRKFYIKDSHLVEDNEYYRFIKQHSSISSNGFLQTIHEKSIFDMMNINQSELELLLYINEGIKRGLVDNGIFKLDDDDVQRFHDILSQENFLYVINYVMTDSFGISFSNYKLLFNSEDEFQEFFLNFYRKKTQALSNFSCITISPLYSLIDKVYISNVDDEKNINIEFKYNTEGIIIKSNKNLKDKENLTNKLDFIYKNDDIFIKTDIDLNQINKNQLENKKDNENINKFTMQINPNYFTHHKNLLRMVKVNRMDIFEVSNTVNNDLHSLLKLFYIQGVDEIDEFKFKYFILNYKYYNSYIEIFSGLKYIKVISDLKTKANTKWMIEDYMILKKYILKKKKIESNSDVSIKKLLNLFSYGIVKDYILNQNINLVFESIIEISLQSELSQLKSQIIS